MRYLKSFLILAAASVLAFSCKKDEPTVVTKPEAPVIENASLKGLNGESVVIAGNNVKFSATLKVKGSKLGKFSLEIRKEAEVLASAEFELEGTEALVEKEFDLPLSPATLDAPFWPDVTMKVTNTDEMFTEEKLAQENNVQITTPELFDALYLVDSNGKVWQMSPTATKGSYRTEGELTGLGSSFSIVSKLNEDNTIDNSGKVWTFDTPDTGEYGIKWIAFNQFTEQMSKMLDLTIPIDFSKMANDQGNSVFWSFQLVQDCRVVFLNFPDGTLPQSDRFADVEKNTARYTGHTGNQFEIYYIPDTKWFIIKEQYIATDVLWVTGMNASLPMSPYCEKHPLNWFASGVDVSYATASCIRTGEGKFSTLLYLKENFAIKIYDGWSWGNELQWESTTPETLVISEMAETEDGKLDGNYGNAGASFSEGLYMLNYNKASRKASLVRYTGTVLGGLETGVADPDPKPIDPTPDPEPQPGEAIVLDKSGMADQKDGTLVRWVLELEQNCTVKFENFDAPIAEMVNLAIFDNIDETAKTARYIGVSEKYEVWYRTEQKWLIFTNNIAAENYLLIGRNASFPQKPYTEFPIIDSDIQPSKAQALPLNKVADGIFRSYIYLADDFAFHLYAGNSWGNYQKGWKSGSEDFLVAHEDGNLFYGTQNINKSFTPGVYLVEYNKTTNTMTLSK